MSLDRLLSLLGGIWDRRVGLIVAPPGAGKTTLLTMFLSGIGHPVAWYRADRWDDRQEALAARLAAAFDAATAGRSRQWRTISEVASGLREWDPPRALFAIDDLHAIAGSPAETAIEQLLDQLPAGLRVLMASRVQPTFNLSRLRVSGDLLEVTADDLRLRTWEVERLFRDHYGEPMAPEETARLAQWSEGWAAGLQLFHLATVGRPPEERRLVLRSLGPHSRLAREYLAQNVLDRVGEGLRRFMVESSVLSRLDAHLCDGLLGREDSAAMLEELERRCLFTTRIDDGPSYRYHEVFRSYLQGVLAAAVGESEVRRRFREAAELYAAAGTVSAALEAYARAEAWEMVDQILETDGETIANARLGWLNVAALPVLREDSWLALAGARRLRAEGRFQDAIDTYAAVIRGSGVEAAASAAIRERAILITLLDPARGPPVDERSSWWSALRDGIAADPLAAATVASALEGPESRLVEGLCLLLGGHVAQAMDQLDALASDEAAEGTVACTAWLASGAAAIIAGQPRGAERVYGAIKSAETLGWEWMARVGRSLLAMTGEAGHAREARRLRETARIDGDPWGVVFACLADAWSLVLRSESPDGHDDATGRELEPTSAAVVELRALGAFTLVAWAEALAALTSARWHSPGTTERIRAAASLARSRKVDGAIWLADLALAVSEGDDDACQRIGRYLQDELGVRTPDIEDGDASRTDRPLVDEAIESDTAEGQGPPATVRLFGSFRLAIDGRDIDVSSLRPRVRSLLRLLALSAGLPVHRETIEEALWPGVAPDAAARNLHVAIASLRRVLEPALQRSDFRLVLRDGETYSLRLPAGSHVDLLDFESAVERLRAAQSSDDRADIERWCRVALERFHSVLLPEEGPAEWVVPRRESTSLSAVEAASTLARLLFARGEWGTCASVCREGLRVDRYHDGLWRMLIDAGDAAGDRAATTVARAGYRRVLAELEVDALTASGLSDSGHRTPGP